MTRRTLGDRILAVIPTFLITDIWQVMLACAFLGLGISSAVAMFFSGGATAAIDRALASLILRAVWSATFLIGGVLQLYALWRPWRSLERLGITLVALGSLAYTLALASSGRPAAWVFVIVFLVFAAGHALVLLVSSIARAKGVDHT